MPRELRGSVVVLTGASSGIGRAAALAFAERGANLVLAARREELLHEVAAECERAGVRAVAVPTDVADEASVQALAQRALDELGRIDVWVNNAGVYLAGRFEETPADAFRRVLETNFFGTVYGARAALPVFRRQGRGVLVNNSSLAGRVGTPGFSAYVASKWAVRGFSESLRQELRDEPGIDVAVVLPASIDTPFFQHAANFSGRALKPLNPKYAPEKVASAIVGVAERPRRELVVGGAGRLQSAQHTLAPALAQRLFAAQVDRDHYQAAPADPTSGNLFEPIRDRHGVTGGWRATGRGRRRGVVAAGGAAAIVVPAVLVGLWRRR